MALDPNELFATVDRGDSQPRMVIEALMPKDFAGGAGADLTDPLPVLTPLAKNTATGFWAPWDANGANGLDVCRGFSAEEIQLKNGVEVIGNVVMRGKIHYDDILAAVEARAIESEADLLTELGLTVLRDAGILVYGLPSVY